MTTVTARLAASCDHVLCGGCVDVVLSYDPSDPFAVYVEFTMRGEEPVEWVFCRELLADGLAARTGLMDVVVEPATERHVLLSLSSPAGSMAAYLPRGPVELFLARTYRLVPAGKESMDLDGVVSRLLTGGVT